MARQRRNVRFRGTVQGVGFRYTACRVAAHFDVTGYVRNLPDGSVELVAEGEDREIDALLRELRDAMAGYVDRTEETSSAARGEFHQFDVRT